MSQRKDSCSLFSWLTIGALTVRGVLEVQQCSCVAFFRQPSGIFPYCQPGRKEGRIPFCSSIRAGFLVFYCLLRAPSTTPATAMSWLESIAEWQCENAGSNFPMEVCNRQWEVQCSSCLQDLRNKKTSRTPSWSSFLTI